MSEMCFYYLFRRDFPVFLAKKNAPFITIFTGIVCICFFHTRAKFYFKKIPTSHFLVMRKKCRSGGRGLVSWSVSLYVRLLVGLLLGNLVIYFF